MLANEAIRLGPISTPSTQRAMFHLTESRLPVSSARDEPYPAAKPLGSRTGRKRPLMPLNVATQQNPTTPPIPEVPVLTIEHPLIDDALSELFLFFASVPLLMVLHLQTDASPS